MELNVSVNAGTARATPSATPGCGEDNTTSHISPEEDNFSRCAAHRFTSRPDSADSRKRTATLFTVDCGSNALAVRGLLLRDCGASAGDLLYAFEKIARCGDLSRGQFQMVRRFRVFMLPRQHQPQNVASFCTARVILQSFRSGGQGAIRIACELIRHPKIRQHRSIRGKRLGRLYHSCEGATENLHVVRANVRRQLHRA